MPFFVKQIALLLRWHKTGQMRPSSLTVTLHWNINLGRLWNIFAGVVVLLWLLPPPTPQQSASLEMTLHWAQSRLNSGAVIISRVWSCDVLQHESLKVSTGNIKQLLKCCSVHLMLSWLMRRLDRNNCWEEGKESEVEQYHWSLVPLDKLSLDSWDLTEDDNDEDHDGDTNKTDWNSFTLTVL